jgi:anti-sigma regulatory factor (Ser/Thr protein kinase)
MDTGTDQLIAVVERSQVSEARHLASRAAVEAGLDEETVHRAGLVATELATNLVRHTTNGGVILLSIAEAGDGVAVQLRALDNGPGIPDLALALTDGHSSGQTPGTGLGAVRRLSLLFDIHSTPESGTAVLARVGAAQPRTGSTPGFEIGAVSVPIPGESVCGDGWTVSLWDDVVTVVVIDGLGHGPYARAAAAAALAVIRPNRPVAAPASLLEAMHVATRSTRGAAGAVCTLRAGGRRAIFCGIGNVMGAILDGESRRQMVSSNGTLGYQVRSPREFSYPWTPDSRVVMASDGMQSHWNVDRYPELVNRHPALLAAVLYRDFSRQRDDVTVVVVAERS